MNISARLLVGLAILLVTTESRGDWITATGAEIFPPSVSEDEACARAVSRAKDQALASRGGEHLLSQDFMACSDIEGQTGNFCSIASNIWSFRDGLITGLEQINRGVIPVSGNLRKCVVSIKAKIDFRAGTPDPKFDFVIVLNEKIYRDGEYMKLRVRPTLPMYVAIFQWQPLNPSEQNVSKLFPNIHDQAHFLENETLIPSNKKIRDYDFAVEFPKNPMLKSVSVGEVLFVVATKSDVEFRDTYTLAEFNQKLVDLPRDTSRISRVPYTVIRGRR